LTRVHETLAYREGPESSETAGQVGISLHGGGPEDGHIAADA
jgi:hypothetical protein